VSRPPFVVLHVCLGNICRSPMAERLLAHRVRERLGDRAEEYVLVESAGTGSWHAGERMHPPAARELRRRGANDGGFAARSLLAAHLDTADLILTATSEQLAFVESLRADAASRAFVLGEFGRLLPGVDAGDLPALSAGPSASNQAVPDPSAVYDRGAAIVAAANALRAGAPAHPDDDLDDPWGRSDVHFTRTADEIETAIVPFVELLLPVPVRHNFDKSRN
jgi:protein-tyrosine phosphatase